MYLPATSRLYFFRVVILIPFGRSKFLPCLGSCWASFRKWKTWREKPREKTFPLGLSQQHAHLTDSRFQSLNLISSQDGWHQKDHFCQWKPLNTCVASLYETLVHQYGLLCDLCQPETSLSSHFLYSKLKCIRKCLLVFLISGGSCSSKSKNTVNLVQWLIAQTETKQLFILELTLTLISSVTLKKLMYLYVPHCFLSDN